MSLSDYLKCPGSDPISKALPESFTCPSCGQSIEIWTDEKGGRCLFCAYYYIKGKEVLKELVRAALMLGATHAAPIPAARIQVRTELADYCQRPGCENHGLSLSCPPHVEGPKAFKDRLADYTQALAVKIEVPSHLLFSSERHGLFQLLHETVSGIEAKARTAGFDRSKGFAGGSCKKIFCPDHNECLGLTQGQCRHPDQARPSMSGFGIDVSRLIQLAGWPSEAATKGKKMGASKVSGIYGLVLVC